MEKQERITTVLTDKQQRFCEEYLVDLNATQAAIRAGYSKKTARSQGQRLLTNVDIQREIQRRMDERSQRTGIDGDRVVQELERIAFAKITDVLDYGPDGVHLKDCSQVSSEVLAAIASVTNHTTKKGRKAVRLKMHNKIAALTLLGRHLGLFTNKVQQSATLVDFMKISAIRSRETAIFV